jgi:hypothetical protein
MEEVKLTITPLSTESIEPYIGVGVYGWETHEEEDVWDVELDFASFEPESRASETDMTIGELMAWKYLQAEREKELVSKSIFIFIQCEVFMDPISIRVTPLFGLVITARPFSTIG